MKKCQMHNKKRDKLSYTVMLHYLAVTGGFVCHFLVHLHDFRQWAVQWAALIFKPQTHLTPATSAYAIFSQPSMQGAAKWARRASEQQVLLSSTLLALVTWSLVWKPSRVTLPLQGPGEAASLPPHAWWSWTCHGWADPQNTPWEEPKLPRSGVGCTGGTEHKIHPPPPPVQFWGRRTFDQPSYPFCCHSCTSCNHTSGCERLKGFKGLPNGEEAARQETVAPCHLPGYCNCFALYPDFVRSVPTYTKQVLFSGRQQGQTLPCCIIYNILWTIQNNLQNTSMSFACSFFLRCILGSIGLGWL